MKKNVLRIFAAVLALCLALSLTACGSTQSGTSSAAKESSTVQEPSTQEEDQTAENTPQTAEEGQDESQEDTGTAGAAAYSSIEEFVSSEEIQSQLEAMQTEEMGVAVTGEGNKLIYTYTFAEGIATDGMAEVLEAGIQAQASTFQSIAATIALAVDVEDPVVVVRYQDSTGAEIYSAEFSAAE